MKTLFLSIFAISAVCFSGFVASSAPSSPDKKDTNAIVLSSFQQPKDTLPPEKVKVYICTGQKSQCYHSRSNCKGLKRCSKEIKSITQADAIKMGRRKCSWCYE